MARWLRQSTSVDVPIGPFLDSVDGVTPETALTITQPDVRLKKNGAAWAQKNAAQTLSHEENGFYEVTLDATDTDTLGLLRLAVFESGAAPVWEDFLVVPSQVWDSYFSTDLLQVHAAEISNGLITAAAVATGAIDADALAADAGTEIATAVWASGTRTLTASLDPTAAAIADAVWDEDATAHQLNGTFGIAIGDPGPTGEDSIWLLVNDRLDAMVSSRLATASYTAPLDAAGTRSAIGLATANLDTQLAALPTAAENATELLDQAAGVETNRTLRQALRLMLAVLCGKASGMATTTATFRDTNDGINRVVATVDSDGNRSAVTLDAS